MKVLLGRRRFHDRMAASIIHDIVANDEVIDWWDRVALRRR